MKKLNLALLLLSAALTSVVASAATSATVTRGTWDLYRSGSSTRLSSHASETACVDAAKALNVTRTYTCRTTSNVAVTVTSNPTCPSRPADESRTQSCPSGSSGTWTQSRTYTSAAYPTCWTAGAWTPSAPPAGFCTPASEPNPPPTGQVITVSPGQSISAAIQQLQPGGTVVVRPGSYSSFSLKACTSSAWCRVMAQVDGTVTVSGLSIGAGNWYTSIEGFKFTGSGQKVINGSYVKLKRDAFVGGPTSGNSVIVQIGSNDRTPGANKILMEDSWVYGAGGRYKVLVYNATNIILRRVVTRTDPGYNNSDGAPEADITVYDSQNVEVQNAIAVDGRGSRAYVAVFYNALNGSVSTPNSTRAWRGNIAINGSGYYMGTEGETSISGLVVEDGAAIGGTYGISQLKGSGNVYRRMTLLNSSGDGFGIFGGSATVSNSIVAGQRGTAFNGVSCSSCQTSTSGLRYLVEPVNGKGANIVNRIGVSGTLYGETGFDRVTDDPLWPWPNQDRIKADFDSVRAAFGGKTLTNYVWEQLGNRIE